MTELTPDEAREFLSDLGVVDSGASQLIRAVYHLLGLRTYLTTGPKETRAWTIRAGDKAPAAAGVIHSDFERGFIAAQTIGFDDLVALGSEAKAREAGKLRVEGKDYVVQDGDVMEFRFNVWEADNETKAAGGRSFPCNASPASRRLDRPEARGDRIGRSAPGCRFRVDHLFKRRFRFRHPQFTPGERPICRGAQDLQ